jgi:hypothetical protein
MKREKEFQLKVVEACHFLKETGQDADRFCRLIQDCMQEGNDKPKFRILMYNRDNHPNGKEAKKVGNYSELIVQDLSLWPLMRDCIDAGAINRSGADEMEIYYGDELVSETNSFNIPTDLEALIPKYDQVHLLVVGCEGDPIADTIVSSTGMGVMKQFCECFITKDRLELQFKNVAERESCQRAFEQGSYQLAYEKFFGVQGYYWEATNDSLNLDTNYKEQLEELKPVN